MRKRRVSSHDFEASWHYYYMLKKYAWWYLCRVNQAPECRVPYMQAGESTTLISTAIQLPSCRHTWYNDNWYNKNINSQSTTTINQNNNQSTTAIIQNNTTTTTNQRQQQQQQRQQQRSKLLLQQYDINHFSTTIAINNWYDYNWYNINNQSTTTINQNNDQSINNDHSTQYDNNQSTTTAKQTTATTIWYQALQHNHYNQQPKQIMTQICVMWFPLFIELDPFEHAILSSCLLKYFYFYHYNLQPLWSFVLNVADYELIYAKSSQYCSPPKTGLGPGRSGPFISICCIKWNHMHVVACKLHANTTHTEFHFQFLAKYVAQMFTWYT